MIHPVSVNGKALCWFLIPIRSWTGRYGTNPAVLLVCGPGNNGGDTRKTEIIGGKGDTFLKWHRCWHRFVCTFFWCERFWANMSWCFAWTLSFGVLHAVSEHRIGPWHNLCSQLRSRTTWGWLGCCQTSLSFRPGRHVMVDIKRSAEVKRYYDHALVGNFYPLNSWREWQKLKPGIAQPCRWISSGYQLLR